MKISNQATISTKLSGANCAPNRQRSFSFLLFTPVLHQPLSPASLTSLSPEPISTEYCNETVAFDLLNYSTLTNLIQIDDDQQPVRLQPTTTAQRSTTASNLFKQDRARRSTTTSNLPGHDQLDRSKFQTEDRSAQQPTKWTNRPLNRPLNRQPTKWTNRPLDHPLDLQPNPISTDCRWR